MREANPTNVFLAEDVQDSPDWSRAVLHSIPPNAMRFLTKAWAAQMSTLGSGESLCSCVEHTWGVWQHFSHVLHCSKYIMWS